MLKRITAFLIALALQATGISSVALGQNAILQQGMDARALQGIEIELKEAQTSRILVEMSSGEVMAVDVADMDDAWFEKGQVWLSFYMDDTLLRGRYLEPDLIKHFEANGSNMSSGIPMHPRLVLQ